MTAFITTLTDYLVKKHFMSPVNATSMVEDEWEYIEEMMISEDGSIEHIAKQLVEIYMVA